MMKSYNLIVLLFFAVMVSNCSKDKTNLVTEQKLQGNYTGRVVGDGIETTTIIGNVSVRAAITSRPLQARHSRRAAAREALR